MSITEFSNWTCAHCGEANETEVDFSAGHHQSLVEDCTVCCRPNVLEIDIDTVSQSVMMEARPENG
jgi:hypothetical protein